MTDFTEPIIFGMDKIPLLKFTNLDLSAQTPISETFKKADFLTVNKLVLSEMNFQITDENGYPFKVDPDAVVYFNLLFVHAGR